MVTELTCAEFHRRFDESYNKENPDQEPLLGNFIILEKEQFGEPKSVMSFIRSQYCCDTHYAMHIMTEIEALFISNEKITSVELFKPKEAG